jgi:GLPGLI family protein
MKKNLDIEFTKAYHFYVLTFLIFLIAGCIPRKEKEKSPVIDEGIVSYSISYTPDVMEKSYSFLLPGEMKYYFRPGQERISFKGDLGLYYLDFILNHTNDSSSTLLKIINKKMFVPASESSKLFIFQSLKNGSLSFDSDTTRTILGYKAKKAIIRLNNRPDTEIIVWYTPQIVNATTNKNTPFSKIPGVMLEFSIYYNDVLFTLKSSSIEKSNLSDSVFAVPNGYHHTTIEEIERTIAEIIR